MDDRLYWTVKLNEAKPDLLNLHGVFEVCLEDDEENVYKIWLDKAFSTSVAKSLIMSDNVDWITMHELRNFVFYPQQDRDCFLRHLENRKE